MKRGQAPLPDPETFLVYSSDLGREPFNHYQAINALNLSGQEGGSPPLFL